MQSKKAMAVSAGLFIALLAVFRLASPAQATEPTCVTSVAHLVNRPDGGHGTDNGGVWALLNVKRTTHVCQVPAELNVQTALDTWTYQATVKDEGALVTLEGDHLSPAQGDALKSGVTGTVLGEFKTETFTAAANFVTYNDSHEGKTYTGMPATDSPERTGNWVAALFNEKLTTKIHSYNWVYTTCNEKWVNASTNNDGTDPGAGDITGKEPCAVPTPTPTASTSATAPPAADALPVTGMKTSTIVLFGAAVSVVGVSLLWLGRRRRS